MARLADWRSSSRIRQSGCQPERGFVTLALTIAKPRRPFCGRRETCPAVAVGLTFSAPRAASPRRVAYQGMGKRRPARGWSTGTLYVPPEPGCGRVGATRTRSTERAVQTCRAGASASPVHRSPPSDCWRCGMSFAWVILAGLGEHDGQERVKDWNRNYVPSCVSFSWNVIHLYYD